MSYYEFFKSCLSAAQGKYKELINTPRARGGNLADEVREILEKIRVSRTYDELTEEEATYLTNEFKKIDFDKLAQARAANKEREKYNVGFKFNR